MKQGLTERVTIRMDKELKEWLMIKGGADFGRKILELAKEKMSKK